MGRFVNADNYAATGQGFVGNNMFVYCNNNPVRYVDITGSFPEAVAAVASTAVVAVEALLPVLAIVVVLVVLTNSEVQKQIKASFESVVTTIKSWTQEEEEIKERLVISLPTTSPPEEKWHLHHIVAQNATAARVAQIIMWDVFPDVGVNHRLNLIYVRQSVHSRLHTNAYYQMVNKRIYDAYYSAGFVKERQVFNVTRELLSLRLYIMSLNALMP